MQGVNAKQWAHAIQAQPMPIGGQSLAKAPQILDEPPERSEEEKSRRKALIDNCTPIKSGAFLIVRHRAKSRTGGGLYKPRNVYDTESIRKVTGTIVKRPLKDEKDPKHYDQVEVGDYVYFSEYAPFSAFPEFPELQMIHADDILMKLVKLPDDVLED